MAEKGSIARAETEAVHHHSHAGRYAIVWIILLALTILTYYASKVHFHGGWHVTVALLIAAVAHTAGASLTD